LALIHFAHMPGWDAVLLLAMSFLFFQNLAVTALVVSLIAKVDQLLAKDGE
jgi:hypothetical protein